MATGYIMLDVARPDPQQGTYPRRGGWRPSGTCIVHTTEGSWMAGVNALTNLVLVRADYGCYHRGCDWRDIAKYYPWEWETWQDSETNNWAVGISAACKTSDWDTLPADVAEGYYRNMAIMAADFVIYMKTIYGITVPLRRLSGAEARAAVPGFCAHGDSGLYRSDPGARFNWTRFFQYTQEAIHNSGGIAPHGGIEDDMFTEHNDAQLTLTLDDAHRTRGLLENIEEPLHAKLLRVNRWVKGDENDTIYELVDGKLRGISGLEWELLGRPTPAEFEQSKIDDMPKVQ